MSVTEEFSPASRTNLRSRQESATRGGSDIARVSAARLRRGVTEKCRPGRSAACGECGRVDVALPIVMEPKCVGGGPQSDEAGWSGSQYAICRSVGPCKEGIDIRSDDVVSVRDIGASFTVSHWRMSIR